MAFAMIPTDRQTGEGSQRANADICGLKIPPVGHRLVPTQKRGVITQGRVSYSQKESLIVRSVELRCGMRNHDVIKSYVILPPGNALAIHRAR